MVILKVQLKRGGLENNYCNYYITLQNLPTLCVCLLPQDSKDCTVAFFSPKIQSSSWDVGSASSYTEAELNFLKIGDLPQSRNSGLGVIKSPSILTKLAS